MLRPRFRAAVAAAMTAMITVAPLSPAAASHVYSPGTPGLGDPYFPSAGNGGYRVSHYDLRLRYTPATDVLHGRAGILARTTQNLSSFSLDLLGLTVESVEVNGRPARWSRQGQELRVTPRHGIPRGRTLHAVVAYHGVPRTLTIPGIGPSGFVHTDDGAVVAGEPDVAATWFPVNDSPRDKASYRVTATVPRGLEVVANGRLVRHSSAGRWTTWQWHAAQPIASYLATMSIGQFRIRTYRTEFGIRMYEAYDPDLGPADRQARRSVGRTPQVLAFLSRYFGRYPFSTGGGTVVDDRDRLRFALENSTRPTYAAGFFDDPVGGDGVVVHESAHQWFGDAVSVSRWSDVWLNEGWATYAEWMWTGRHGRRTPADIAEEVYADAPASAAFWRVEIANPGVTRLFDDAVYSRGALTLQALRAEVGDASFFTIARRWVATYGRGTGSTAEFVALAERVCGRQLDGLFHTWLHTTRKPAGARFR